MTKPDEQDTHSDDRQHDDGATTQAQGLEAFMNTLYRRGEPETTASAAEQARIVEHNKSAAKRHRKEPLPGFAEGSVRHLEAIAARVPLIHLGTETEQQDLFASDETPGRFEINEDSLWLKAPYGYGGAPPEDTGSGPLGEIDEWETAVGWDENTVMIVCPRGACIISRTRWNEGWRCCPGC